MKFDPETKRLLGLVTLGTLLLTAIEIGLFFAFGKYTADVLYGAILSAVAGILEIVLLAVTVTRVLNHSPEEEAAAKGLMKLSWFARALFLLAALAVGVILFNVYSTLITIFFPRAIIGVCNAVAKRRAAGFPGETRFADELAESDGEESETKGSEEDGTDEN